MKSSKILFSLTALCLPLIGCGSGTQSENSSSSSSFSASSDEINITLTSACGTITDTNVLNNPVPEDRIEFVSVSATTSDTVVITRRDGDQAGNSQVVKLHGVSSTENSGFLHDSGVDLINSLTRRGAYFVPAGDGCDTTVFDGAVQGILGQLYTTSGQNVTEALIANGSVAPSLEICGADALVGCYSSIPVQEHFSSKVIRSFLWKPVSERDGRVVVLVNSSRVTVRVTGAVTETFTDFGPSNGRGTTARGNRAGCGYGRATVEFFDSSGRRTLLNNGQRSVTVPNGCDRLDTTF